MQQKKIFKLIIEGAKMLDLYRGKLRMVPQDIEPICQEMMVKVVEENEPSSKKFKSNDVDFNSMISKTKQQENLLKIFRKDKLLNDNEFYLWVRNYQINDNDLLDLTTVCFRLIVEMKSKMFSFSAERTNESVDKDSF